MLVNAEEIRNRVNTQLVKKLEERSQSPSKHTEEIYLSGVCDGYRQIITMFDEMIGRSGSSSD